MIGPGDDRVGASERPPGPVLRPELRRVRREVARGHVRDRLRFRDRRTVHGAPSVNCSNCGAENRPGRKFCVRCATPLAAVCPSCGAPYDPGDAFCGECATPLATVGPATAPARVAVPAIAVAGAVAERRLVSVLFADLVGFTPFAEERDAEDVRDTLTRYFDIATDVIGRYGGTIEKFIGDAVMAVWGTPTAREDDAERSVRAALDLVDAVQTLGPGIQARAGVLTGDAAVTLGATNQGMVAGDLVNTAARLQSVAPPGAVLVGEHTMRAASAAIAFEEAGEQALKGKTAPVPAYRALRVVAQRRGGGRSDLPEPPFVGRDEELRLLKDQIATTGRDRRTRLVSITGPGGIGKSRLAWELEKYIDGITETIYWHRGRSPAYGEGITFWALGEMVRRRAGLAETDDESTTRERIGATVAEFVPTEDDRRWVEPALLTLLGFEPAPAGGRDVLFAAWRIFFERVAERATTVMLFEDLQWADSGLLDFIDHLLEWSKSVPLIIVTLARPELLDRRPDWGAGTRNLTRLALEPLSDEAMRQLLDGFVPGLPEAAVAAILARADGVPLYAVETVRSLVAEGRLERDDATYRPIGELGELAVPDTLRSLIASRLDALDPVDRSLVADASVLGQSFGLAGLTALSGQDAAALEPRLKALVRRELFDLEIDPRSPERGQYRFVQSLIREVAYGTLAKRERRARHLAAARHFEALGDDELAGALASHYVAAHEASADGAEADAVAIQARLALSGGADRAAALGSHDQAVAYLRQAIAITADSRERAALHLRAAISANTAARHDDALALVRAGIDLARSVDDPLTVGTGEAMLGEILIDAGQPAEAVAVLEAAAAQFPDDGSREVRATILANLSRAFMRTGEPAKSIRSADLALDLAEHLGLDRLIAETLNNKGSSLGYLGRQRESIALLAASVDLAEAGGFVKAEIRARSNLATTDDDPRRSFEMIERGLELARRVGDRSMANWTAANRMFLTYLVADGWDEALAREEDELAEARAHAVLSPLDEVRSLWTQGLVRVARGEPIDATLASLEALAERTSDTFAVAAVHMLRGENALLAGEHADAVLELLISADEPNLGEALLETALRAALWGGDVSRAREIADRLDAHPSSTSFTRAARFAARAGIAALDGRRDEAIAGYRDALARYRGIGHALELGRTSLDFLRLLGPSDPSVDVAVDEARSIFERIGARAYLDQLDAAMARPPAVGRATRAGVVAETSGSAG
jgi:class 3 adenylate cyclase/tetratricopeptide (TPR) repeat protein